MGWNQVTLEFKKQSAIYRWLPSQSSMGAHQVPQAEESARPAYRRGHVEAARSCVGGEGGSAGHAVPVGYRGCCRGSPFAGEEAAGPGARRGERHLDARHRLAGGIGDARRQGRAVAGEYRGVLAASGERSYRGGNGGVGQAKGGRIGDAGNRGGDGEAADDMVGGEGRRGGDSQGVGRDGGQSVEGSAGAGQRGGERDRDVGEWVAEGVNHLGL